MIGVYHEGHNFHYELDRLIRMFLSAPVTDITAPPRTPPYIKTSMTKSGGIPLLSVAVNLNGTEQTATGSPMPDEGCELALSRLLYHVLAEQTGSPLRWGLVTGVRPVKLARTLIDQGLDCAAVSRRLTGHYLLSVEAAALTCDVLAVQEQVVGRPEADEFGLYISIPFCPTRCSYCSFVSHSVDKAAGLIPDYLDCLCAELAEVGEVAATLGLKLTCVYMGGGTPTTLTAEQLTRVMDTVRRCFDLSHLREYTVEAGRPDTVTREKLLAIKAGGAERVSINPQTLDDAVLARIGRGHSTAQFFEAFALARDVGFACINTDLIAGLPGDTIEGFRSTVDRIVALNPENVTVHTLSIKRAAGLGGEPLSVVAAAAQTVGEMVDYARSTLKEAGQRPYYLYRQQNTLGGYENVGYARPGHEGLYNIVMMEETGSVMAVGAGAVTRLIGAGGQIERIFALKYPYEYITRPQKRADKKARIVSFYEDGLSR